MLFARSITDNISYGLPTVPFEMVVEAAQKANAHGFIMELQDGYNTGMQPRSITFTVPKGQPSGMQSCELSIAFCQLLFIISGEIHLTILK